MIVVPGDTPADVISAVIADEAAIGMVNTKTTAVRLIPAIGKKEGDTLEFGGHFRRRTSRPVSYYALFKCVAASEPTSWLSLKSHILFHLTRTLGP